jgi:hypothetical protein
MVPCSCNGKAFNREGREERPRKDAKKTERTPEDHLEMEKGRLVAVSFSSAGVSPAVRRASRPLFLKQQTCRQVAGGTYAGEVFPLRPSRLRAFVVNTTGLRLVFQQSIDLTDTGFRGIERAGVVNDVVGLLNFL